MRGFPVPLRHNVSKPDATGLRMALRANSLIVTSVMMLSENSGVTFRYQARYVIGEQETSSFLVHGQGMNNPLPEWKQPTLFELSRYESE